jgi:cytoskeletal protein CcmA (bactofilin family)
MWRKQQEEPKSNANVAPEVKEQPRAEQRVEQRPEQSSPAAAPAQVAPPFVVREATPPAAHLTSTLVIKGEITGRDDLFIDGEVQGKIRLEQGKVTIGPNGRVSADVDAQEIVIRGQVKGNLNGRDRVEIGKTGRATGDIITQRILVEDGAEMHGRVEIKRIEARQQPEQSQEKKKPAVVATSATTTQAVPTPAVNASAASVPAVAGKGTTPPAVAGPGPASKNVAEPVPTPARESAPVV